MQNETISLYFSEGGSDKEYHADLVETEAGFLVNFRYGRRGSALTSGTKTKDPLPYDKAKKVYDKLVAEKMGKGYSTGEAGTAYQDTPKESLYTGVLPQLLNPVSEADLERLFKDASWVMQEKMDGERRMVSNVGGEWFGINRKGMRVPLPVPLVEALSNVIAGTTIDGEIIGDVYYPFDMLDLGGQDMRTASYDERFAALMTELHDIGVWQDEQVGSYIKPVISFVHEGDKREAYAEIAARNGEGVVFKRMNASHSVGRPNSGGDHLKFKFVESGTFIVAAQNDTKRSVQVAAFDEIGNKVLLGNVTIPPNYEIPQAGDVVEVEYLYAFEGGAIYQPVYRGKRADQDLGDCKMAQLKYKPMANAA